MGLGFGVIACAKPPLRAAIPGPLKPQINVTNRSRYETESPDLNLLLWEK
jgi:hypothetical protein